MTARNFILSLVVLATECSSSGAILVGNSYSNTQPFDVVIYQNGHISSDLVLQIANVGNSATSVISWQLDLTLRPLPGSQGTMSFEEVLAPSNSLFGAEPGPLSDLKGPSNHISVFDADYDDFVGIEVGIQEVRHIAALKLSANTNSYGDFELIARAHDPFLLDLGSSWFPTGSQSPQAFENLEHSTLPGYILLGTFRVQNSVPVGDYNQDQNINALDYDCWRLAFGAITGKSEMNSDGDRNSIVDAADYVVWRKAAEEHSMSASRATETVPEPSLLLLCHAVVVLVSFTWVGARSR